jgi:hypothetical protein
MAPVDFPLAKNDFLNVYQYDPDKTSASLDGKKIKTGMESLLQNFRIVQITSMFFDVFFGMIDMV